MSVNGYGTPWTEQVVADLTRLYAEGFSCRVIGEKLGLGRNSVIGKIHRLQLPLPEGKKPIIRMGREIGHYKKHVSEVKIACVEIVPRNLSLLELEPNDCRYPYGDGPFTFCGHPKQAGSSYCTPHFHLCDQPPKPRQARAWVNDPNFARRSA